MHVMTDGKSVEVIAPQLLKNRAIGLCGDMNGEEIADLSTPKRCIMQPKLVAISYMLNRNGYDAKFAQCHNIEPQDLAAYQREDQKCAKEEVVKTPILAIFERVQRMTLPLVAMHKVEKQTNKVCISKEKVKTCGSLLTGKQLGSGSMKEKLVKYACVSAPSAKAESLKNRAMAGEALDFELNELPISYTKMEKEPFYCGVKGGKLKLYQGCDMNAGVLNNPACGSGEKCVSVYGSAGDCEPISLNATSLTAVPEFHDVLIKSPNMANYLYEDQIQSESKVSDGVIYSRSHPGGKADDGFGEVLQET